eukprot:jgi/Ulvmu1/43/UM001_0046.1
MFIYAASVAQLHLAVVTGQGLDCSGSCVDTWKKCAGEGIAEGTMRACCKEEDQCVEKTSSFSQCRPISAGIPPSWPSGEVLTCTEPGCDPATIAARFSGLSAFRFAENRDIELENFDSYDLAVRGTTCLEECQANDDCFAFDETADGDCVLFDKNLISLDGTLIPFFDGEVHFTKCFLPEPLCDPATREARRVNSVRRDDGEFHWMASDEDFRDFFIADAPATYALTAAINACRLQQFDGGLGGCIGFAMEDSEFGTRVTLHYNFIDSSTHTAYRGDQANKPRVYNIEACF